MDERKQELKRLKMLSKRAKWKHVTGWKTVSVIMLVMALLFTPLSLAVKTFDNTVAHLLGGAFWELEDEDENAVYFGEDFDSREELDAYSRELVSQVVSEGAVLLKNEEQALPLQRGAKISLFVEAAADFSAGDNLQTALEKAGFTVTEMLAVNEETMDMDPAYGDVTVVLTDKVQDAAELLGKLAGEKTAGKRNKIIWLAREITGVTELLQAGIDAVLWIGDADGGADGIGDILSGQVSPSGRLPVTVQLSAEKVCGNVRQESIYADYKYFETHYEDYVLGVGNPGDYRYAEHVAYPFGYGLRYTAFTYSDMQVVYNEKADRFEVTVTVTNTGSMAGREVVQLYAQAPYTEYDKTYGVEKAAVNLVGFDKTDILESGSSETVTVYVHRRNLASYDAHGAGTYILDEGHYFLTVASDAHKAVNNILAAKGYTPENTQGRMDEEGNGALTWQWVQEAFDKTTYAVSYIGTAVSNQLAFDSDLEETFTWLSRKDWEGTLAQAPLNIEPLTAEPYKTQENATASMPTLGAKNGVKLYDMRGLGFDDVKWQTLLDQLTFADMEAVLGDAYQWSMPIPSVHAPGVRHGDATVLGELFAAAFDRELAYKVGKLAGNRALLEDSTLLYSAVDGIADSFLTGKLLASYTQGMQNKGVIVVLKPFANEVGLWYNEQAARERYLPAMQYAMENDQTVGVMTASARWAGILRQEWGSKGILFVADTLTPEGVVAGVTGFSACLPNGAEGLAAYEDDPAVVSAMRQACHYHLYALANSAAMNGMGADTTVKAVALPAVILCRTIAVCSAILAAVLGIMWCRGKGKWKKTQAYLDYRTMRSTLKEEKKVK